MDLGTKWGLEGQSTVQVSIIPSWPRPVGDVEVLPFGPDLRSSHPPGARPVSGPSGGCPQGVETVAPVWGPGTNGGVRSDSH